MTPASRVPGFRGEFLWEFEIAERQLMAIANTMPPEKYDWRPDAHARSAAEVLVHVATGGFMLLDMLGESIPTELYASLPAGGQDRFWALVRLNDELIGRLRDKAAIVELLQRFLRVVRETVARLEDDELNRRMHFFGEETTVRRAYLRLLVHTHEHMGQLIAYLRMNDMPAPWPDWRPDRR